MTVAHWVHIDTYLSLGVITLVLIVAIVASELKTRRLRRAGSGNPPSDPHAH
jgi:hypothetical protein